MIKFIGGPVTASALGLKPFETVILSVLGMMTSVLIFSTLGSWIKTNVFDRFRKPVLFTKNNRKLVIIWSKYGIQGVAFLTPILLSPIIGTMVAISFGEERRKIILYMLISSIFWGLILTFSLHQIKMLLVQWS